MVWVCLALIVLGAGLAIWGAVLAASPPIERDESGRLVVLVGTAPGSAGKTARQARALTIGGTALSTVSGVVGLFLP